MARISLEEAQGWVDRTKVVVATLDLALLNSIETEVIARVGSAYNTSTWVDATTTPSIVRVVIAKLYAAWIYDRAYAENNEISNSYAAMLRTNAEMLITGILDSTIDVPNATATGSGTPGFFPNDASSMLDTTPDEPYNGPAAFSMGKSF